MEFKCTLLLIVFVCCHNYFAFDLPRDGCSSDLNINHDLYNVSAEYHVGDADPTDAHFDVFGNLFYVETGLNVDGYYYNVKVIKFGTGGPDIIPGLPEGISYSVAVDTKNTKVFFGTGRGLFTYNYETHSATRISESSLKLNMVFVDKDGNRYITEIHDGIEELYLYDKKKKYCFHTLEALSEMAIDEKNNFYYIRDERLCVLKWSVASPVCIGNLTYDGMAQIAIHNDTVYVASDNLWYFHENDTANLKLVVNAPGNLTAIAFESSGEFVLGIHGKLLKYKRNRCFIRD